MPQAVDARLLEDGRRAHVHTRAVDIERRGRVADPRVAQRSVRGRGELRLHRIALEREQALGRRARAVGKHAVQRRGGPPQVVREERRRAQEAQARPEVRHVGRQAARIVALQVRLDQRVRLLKHARPRAQRMHGARVVQQAREQLQEKGAEGHGDGLRHRRRRAQERRGRRENRGNMGDCAIGTGPQHGRGRMRGRATRRGTGPHVHGHRRTRSAKKMDARDISTLTPWAPPAMNAYPVDLVVELQPCVHASGLLPDDAAPPGLAHPPTEHPALCAALAEALAPRTRAALWTAAGAGERVRATLVHRDHTLPPARMRAGQRVPDAAARRALAALPPRSPLSPLFPGGPLFPDGLVTPSWIRKHGEYIPAVRLAFFCMPPDRGDTLAKDAALIEALTALRASLAPRGTRLVAVLLCEPVLYAQGVDARVAHVRRAAGLDTRGAVYALSTAAHADHAAFLRHIHTRVLALARDVYRERARHVRRHRARCPPPPSVVQPVLQAAAHAQLLAPAQPVLSAPGWNVRLFFKLGALAEWQADYGEARALYEDAYRELMDVYFRASPAKPPARRCVEAQVLADALVLRLVRLHLYAHAPARARAQLEQHIAAIDAQCAAWGLAPTAPERWAWPAKAYGLLAELAHEAQRPPSVHGLDEGLLYYHAALCHLEALRCAAPADAARGAAVSCLSAAYDAFRHTQRARLAHWAAVRLAQAYLPAKPAQALPFLERTLRWYRRDGWPMLRARLALTALAAALPCEDRAAVARLALELQQPVPPSLAR